MSIDDRLNVKQAMFGCHSELDKYRVGDPRDCTLASSETELACSGCTRINHMMDEQKGTQ